MHKPSVALSRRSPVLLPLAAALTALACGGAAEPSDPLAPAAADATPEALEAEALTTGGPGHAMPLSGDASAAPKAGRHLDYYGGRVLDRAAAVAVLWGSGVSPAVASGIGPFYSALLRSTFFDWLTEYDTTIDAVDGKPGTGQTLARGSLEGVHAIEPAAHGRTLTDAAIRRELTRQIGAKKLPAPTAQTVYLVSLPPGVSVELGGARSCTSGGFCGYHNSYQRAGKEVVYAVLPDLGPGSGCEAGCGKAASQFDQQTSVASHELFESITDPGVGRAKALGRPLAWYDHKSGEIGDLCAGEEGKLHAASGKTYTVQKEWSNKGKACITARGKGGSASGDTREDASE
jgi:hypothetical protein